MLYLLVTMCLCGSGIVVIFYGAGVIVNNLVIIEQNVNATDNIEIKAELDPMINEIGVIVIDSPTFIKNTLYSSLYDPYDNLIITELISNVPLEKNFNIDTKGEYRLVVENTADQITNVIGVITYYPDEDDISFSILGVYLLIGGLASLVIIGIITIRNMKKR